MLKKAVLTLAAITGLGSSAFAVDLTKFQPDFQVLMDSLARDATPALRLGALSGDLESSAVLKHFDVSPLGIGLTTANGLGRVLSSDSGVDWKFQALPLAKLVNDNLSDKNAFEHLMAYPAFKTAVGMAFLPGWDATLSGFYFPKGITTGVVDLVEADKGGKLHGITPDVTFGNIGIQVRRALLQDGDGPALSLGLGYHYTFFNLDMTLRSLTDLGMTQASVDVNQTLDMSGPLSVATHSQVLTADLHVSKKWSFLEPYAKLSGAYQNSTFEGKANMVAKVTDSVTPTNNSSQNVDANSSVNLSDFAFLATTGIDFDLFVMHFNLNVTSDLSRAFLKVRDLSLNGIDPNAFNINTGFHFQF